MQALAQTGAIRPEIAQQQMQQMQMQGQQQAQIPPDQIEARVAQVENELLVEVMPMLTYKGAGEEQDPLVTIRMQELAIKKMEAEQKSQMDQAKLQLDQMKMQQSAVTDSSRLELQEQIADERSDVNRERIDMQRQAMEQRNASRNS
jgi:hypothetical protein